MKIREINAKTILSKSQVSDYALNAYVGCQHGCVYCYAKFMKRFTGHKEKWGEFVDVKVNAAELLAIEVKRKRPGRVWISGVCDPYQALEKRYKLTRRSLEILVENGWPVTVQTKSPLVLRDIGILKRSEEAEVGFTITTADEKIRTIFEPGAPPIPKRIEALAQFHSEGIRTFAMIAPILPGSEELVTQLAGKVDYVLLDKLNYHYADQIYIRHGFQWAMKEDFFQKTGETLKSGLESSGIPFQILF